MPKTLLVLAALLLFSYPAHAEKDFRTMEPDAVCGNVGLYDFGSVIDGPAYYVDMKTFKPLCHIGGQCRGPGAAERCACAPDVWTCAQPDLMAIHDARMLANQALPEKPIATCNGINYYHRGAANNYAGFYTNAVDGVMLANNCGGKRVYSREPANCPPAGWTCLNPDPTKAKP